MSDTTLVWDRGNARYLIVGPDAKPVRSLSPGGDGNGFGDARFSDARGRLYAAGRPFGWAADGTLVPSDSAPILRYTIATNRVDTVAYMNLTKNGVSERATSSGGEMRVSIRLSSSVPFAAADDWAVLADGRVVIVRVADYHVEIVHPDGRRMIGPVVRYSPVKITDPEKNEWRANQAPGQTTAVSEGLAGRPAAPPAPERHEWPAVKPPFLGSATWPGPNGETWVMRTRAARDRVPTMDVFDSQAKLVARVVLPAGSSVVGFGAQVVYLVRTDGDDVEYLQRYKLPQ
jgi:hypothetical protein